MARIKEQIASKNCFKCGETGHWSKESPYNSDKNKGGNVMMMTLGKFDEEKFYGYKIALDIASEVNIVHPRFLTNIRSKKPPSRVLMEGGKHQV